eukprot:7902463-Alexandrium_andersonii.AAC.1
MRHRCSCDEELKAIYELIVPPAAPKPESSAVPKPNPFPYFRSRSFEDANGSEDSSPPEETEDDIV